MNGIARSTESSITPQKSQKTESVKTVKRRIEKLKDQKAAKTLRFNKFSCLLKNNLDLLASCFLF